MRLIKIDSPRPTEAEDEALSEALAITGAIRLGRLKRSQEYIASARYSRGSVERMLWRCAPGDVDVRVRDLDATTPVDMPHTVETRLPTPPLASSASED